MRRSDVFVIAAWAGTIFGLAEGVILCICRAFPAVLAPFKVSAHGLWVAPSIDLPLFVLAGVGVVVFLRWALKWLGTSKLLVAYGFYVFLGLFTLLTAPKMIHLISATLLSLGLTAVFCRRLRGWESRFTSYLRSRLVWIPVLIVIAGLGVYGYERVSETWIFRRLSPIPKGATNVLVVVMDTVRFDSFTRPAKDSLTPNINKIVARGVRFENAWAPSSWTLPSQASILTGRYPHEHAADWPYLRLENKSPTLAEFFAGRGYVTGAFSGNGAWVTPEYLGRGFLRFNVYTLENLFRRTVHGRSISRLLWEVGYHIAGRGKKAPTVNAQFLKFLDDYPDRPFFAYLCYMDVNQAFHNAMFNHGFWVPTPPVQEIVRAYEQGLNQLDEHIGKLFTELEQRGILKNTLVVITSDHGQSFGAENANDHDPFGHGTSLYPEQTRVPLFVIHANRLGTGQKITSAVSLRQIPATITHLMGLADLAFLGDPLPIQDSSSENFGAPVLTTLNYRDHKLQSVIWNGWQYINNLNNPNEGEEVYDLTADPFEKKSLTSAHADITPIRAVLQQLISYSRH